MVEFMYYYAIVTPLLSEFRANEIVEKKWYVGFKH